MEIEEPINVYLADFIVKLKRLADEFNEQGLPKDYKSEQWVTDCIHDLMQASNVLGNFAAFLQTPRDGDITWYTLNIFQQNVKRYSELLGPLVIVFSIVVTISCADQRMHESRLREFRSDLDDIEQDLKYFKLILPKLTHQLLTAGQLLNRLTTAHAETGEEEINRTVNKYFDRVDLEMDIAKDHIKNAEESLIVLEKNIQLYRQKHVHKNVLLMLGVSAASTVACYGKLVSQQTMYLFIGMSAIPLLHMMVILPADINELVTTVKSKSRIQRRQRRESKDLDRRFELVKKGLDICEY